MKTNFKTKISVWFVVMFLTITCASAAVYDYTGAIDLGVWSGDFDGHYMWYPIEYYSQFPQLMRMLQHDAMMWVVSPLRQPDGYADPDVNSPNYIIPTGQHYYTGARWFAPEGEIITKLEFTYGGYFGGGLPQFSIFAGTADTPDLLYYMSSISYVSYDDAPFAIDFNPSHQLKSMEVRCWDAYPGDNVADEITCWMENIKVTTAAEPAPFPMTCGQIWAAGQGIPGDINKDCKVDFEDFAEFAAQWMMDNNP